MCVYAHANLAVSEKTPLLSIEIWCFKYSECCGLSMVAAVCTKFYILPCTTSRIIHWTRFQMRFTVSGKGVGCNLEGECFKITSGCSWPSYGPDLYSISCYTISCSWAATCNHLLTHQNFIKAPGHPCRDQLWAWNSS